jgi:hypothetical protein
MNLIKKMDSYEFSLGYPQKIEKHLTYSLKDIEAIKVELKQGLDPQRTIYLRLKPRNPLTVLVSLNFKRY